MGATTTFSICFLQLATTVSVAFFLLAAASSGAAAPAWAVRAVYVFGDSLANVGNNHLPTLLRADFPHNGVDYPGNKATGRFSNGKNFPDFLGKHCTTYMCVVGESLHTPGSTCFALSPSTVYG